MMEKIFFYLVLFFILHLGYRVYSYRQNYTTLYDSKYWQKRYEKSQWVTFMSKDPIGDDGLYAYAGWEYVHGKNPILNSPEVPPLGKYLIGYSILVFQNQNIFALIVGLLTLGVFFLHNLIIFKDKLSAFLPVFFFSFEPIFFEQLKAPYLDLLQFLFLLLVFICVQRKKIELGGIFLGCFAATKNTYLSLLVAFAVFIFIVLQRDKHLYKRFLLCLLISLFTFTITYLQFFRLGNSILDFLKVQKFIITNSYIMAAKSSFGIIIPMLISGFWFTWWDTVERVTEWLPIWPVLCIFLFYYLFGYKTHAFRDRMSLNTLWISVYFFFLLFIPVFPRYLLLLLPFLYNLFVWVLSNRIDSKSSY